MGFEDVIESLMHKAGLTIFVASFKPELDLIFVYSLNEFLFNS